MKTHDELVRCLVIMFDHNAELARHKMIQNSVGQIMSRDRLLFPALPFIIKLLLFAAGYKHKAQHNLELTKVNGSLY